MPVLRSSLRWKIALPAILTTAVTVVTFARYTVEEVTQTMEQREKMQLVAIAEMLARHDATLAALEEGAGRYALGPIRSVLDDAPSIQRIEVYAGEEDGEFGEVLSVGWVGQGLLPPWGDMSRSGVRTWRTAHAAGYVVAVPIQAGPDLAARQPGTSGAGPQQAGTLLLWASREPIVRAITGYVEAVVPVGVGLLVLAMSLGVLITTSMLRHLRGLTDAAESFGRGSRDVQIPVHGHDEIATLTRTFNTMVAKLDTSRHRIEEQNRTLEQKVEARTRELLRAYEELQNLDRAKDSFLSSVSHELRTPLTSIRSFAEILLEYGDSEDPELRREFLTIIKDESERLSRLINQVLDLAKIEAGVMTWALSTFDFRDLVETAVRALKGLVHQKPVELRVEMPDEKVGYFGDRDRIHQVLTNLITNAWKFSPEHEVVRIVLRKVDGGIEVRVADRGPGVPGEEEKEQIFDRFRQGAHTLTDKPEGTGLGLPISKEIVCMHGGFIGCDDNPGGGAVFLFLLPDPDPAYPRPVDEAAAGDSGLWKDLHDPRRSSIFESSWVWAARNT